MSILQELSAHPERVLLPDEVCDVVDALEHLVRDERTYWVGCLYDWGLVQTIVIEQVEQWMAHWLIEKYDVDENTYFNHRLCKQFYEQVRPIETLLSDLGVDWPSNHTLMPQHFSLMRALPDSWTQDEGTYIGPWGKFSLSFHDNNWGGFDVSALVEFNETQLAKIYTVDELIFVASVAEG